MGVDEGNLILIVMSSVEWFILTCSSYGVKINPLVLRLGVGPCYVRL